MSVLDKYKQRIQNNLSKAALTVYETVGSTQQMEELTEHVQQELLLREKTAHRETQQLLEEALERIEELEEEVESHLRFREKAEELIEQLKELHQQLQEQRRQEKDIKRTVISFKLPFFGK